jgi:hypothetical protein
LRYYATKKKLCACHDNKVPSQSQQKKKRKQIKEKIPSALISAVVVVVVSSPPPFHPHPLKLPSVGARDRIIAPSVLAPDDQTKHHRTP